MAEIQAQRRCGNTTRQVDEWVQLLFANDQVCCTDHAHTDTNMAQKEGISRLFNRLYNEHSLKMNKDYTYNQITHTVTLK